VQVRRLSEICHRNIVTLIGSCQEAGLQMLVFEFSPNGNVSSHLYGNMLFLSEIKFCLSSLIILFEALVPFTRFRERLRDTA
jgi:hypothetical protein